MTTKGEWVAYTGSDEQIAEMQNAECGFIILYESGCSSDIQPGSGFVDGKHLQKALNLTRATHYWIIPDDPLREMKIRQAMTGQPVWVRDHKDTLIATGQYEEYVTTNPDWRIPTAQYSFTPFEDTSK